MRALRCVWVWEGRPREREREGPVCGTLYRRGGRVRVFIQRDGCTLNLGPIALSHNDKYPGIAQSTCHLRMRSAPLRPSSTITIAATAVILHRQGCR